MTPISSDPICDVLRRIRTLAGLSLAQVEAKSDGRWKAVVVGSYERGTRRPTVEVARALLDFYGFDPQPGCDWTVTLGPPDFGAAARKEHERTTHEVGFPQVSLLYWVLRPNEQGPPWGPTTDFAAADAEATARRGAVFGLPVQIFANRFGGTP